jgi:hypothetical protein
LWIYYNFQRVKRSDLDNLSSLNNTIASLKQKNNWIIPLWIWNWTTVYDATDIATQFLVSSGVNWISWISLKKWLADYLSYWDTTGINWYNARFSELKNDNKTSLHLFSRWEIYMVIWYPSLINRIKDAWWYSKNLLQVAPFPHSLVWWWNTLVNYNYFTINKSTSNLGLAQNFLAYLATDAWEQKFLDSYPYYLPALVSLETEEMSEKLINSDFNITLWDFYNEKVELVSFDKWIRDIYDKEITLLLDNAFQQEQSYTKLKDTIMCKLDKIKNFENLSEKCE